MSHGRLWIHGMDYKKKWFLKYMHELDISQLSEGELNILLTAIVSAQGERLHDWMAWLLLVLL